MLIRIIALIFVTSLSLLAQMPIITQVNEDLKNTRYYSKSLNYSSIIDDQDQIRTFLFYQRRHGDTYENYIYHTQSSDFGNSWSEVERINTNYSRVQSNDSSEVAKIIQLSNNDYFGVVKLNDYDLLFIKSTNLEVFDSVSILPGYLQKNRPEIVEANDGTIYLTYYKYNSSLILRESTDQGLSWSEEKIVVTETDDQSTSRVQEIGEDHLIISYSLSIDDEYGILTTKSFDNGLSWETSKVVLANTDVITKPYLSKSDDGTLWITYQKTLSTPIFREPNAEIYFVKSTDNGNAWTSPEKFTTFLGNDRQFDISDSKYGPLLTFSSNRTTSNKNTIHLGIVGESSDPSPPVIHEFSYDDFSLGGETQVLLKAEDDDQINEAYVRLGKIDYPLYDDGMHQDESAGDNIYGNRITNIGQTHLTNEALIDVNNITLPINNKGILADVNIDVNINGYAVDSDSNISNYKENTSIYGSVGRYGSEMKSFLFSGGFFLSGYQDTSLWANAVASSSLIEDYFPGNVGSSADDPDNKIYTVFIDDTPFEQSWQDWGKAVEQGAYFYDGDNDGEYHPVDKNSNGQWDYNEDKPDILYDVTYFTVYNDGAPSTHRRWNTVEPMGIEIRQSAFASGRNSILDDVVFVRYSIVYKGLGDAAEPDSLTDVVFGIWNDVDIGGTSSAAADDLTGSDSLLQSGFIYNDGEDDDWGVNPPAVFKTIVQGPLVKSDNPNDIGYNKMGPDLGEQIKQGYKNLGMNTHIHYLNSTIPIHDPNSAGEARNYMLGLIGIIGAPPDPCYWSFGEVRNENCFYINRKLWYNGDPVSDIGWINTDPADQRDLTSTGKFTLYKNEPMDIIVAYTVGRGTDALNSITVARETVEYVLEEYERNFSTVVGIEEYPDNLVNSFSLSQNYPNPFNPTTTIEYTIPGTPLVSSPSVKGRTKEGFVSLVVYNILGQKVKTILNETKAPGSYKITFDASQLASGVYFYRLTSGSFVQTKKMMVIK